MLFVAKTVVEDLVIGRHFSIIESPQFMTVIKPAIMVPIHNNH